MSNRENANQVWVCAVLLIAILFVTAVRLRFLDVPLERDEGEYAYAGQLILRGIPPYARVYNMKLPGIYAAYALILAIFGQSCSSVHMGLLIVNIATIILMFLLGKSLFSPVTGMLSAVSFAVLSLSQPLQGIFANAEHFVILPAVGGAILLLRATDSGRKGPLFWSGLLFATSFMIKQHGAAFVAFGAVYLFLHELTLRPFDMKKLAACCGLFLLGAIVPLILTLAGLLISGVFERFWFCAFRYALKYVSLYPLRLGWLHLKTEIGNISSPSLMLCTLVVMGIVAVLLKKDLRHRKNFVLTFLFFSFLAVCPGLYFRGHYFLFLVPASALFIGIAAVALGGLLCEKIPLSGQEVVAVCLVLAAAAWSVFNQRQFMFGMSPLMASRVTYGMEPFPEALQIADYIKKHSAEKDTVAVLGSEPEIYFYSKRLSATGYIYAYPLMEYHEYALRMQKEMISEIESAFPEFIVFVNVRTSWALQKKSDVRIFEWFNEYGRKNYRQVGLLDFVSLIIRRTTGTKRQETAPLRREIGFQS